jgi:hypothetical protein
VFICHSLRLRTFLLWTPAQYSDLSSGTSISKHSRKPKNDNSRPITTPKIKKARQFRFYKSSRPFSKCPRFKDLIHNINLFLGDTSTGTGPIPRIASACVHSRVRGGGRSRNSRPFPGSSSGSAFRSVASCTRAATGSARWV